MCSAGTSLSRFKFWTIKTFVVVSEHRTIKSALPLRCTPFPVPVLSLVALTCVRLLQSTTRVKPFICTMPMRLDEGWNQIQFNLSDFTRRAYGTNYIETLRVQIHANCRMRRIYFSDRLYSEDELPPEFKLFLPVQHPTAK